MEPASNPFYQILKLHQFSLIYSYVAGFVTLFITFINNLDSTLCSVISSRSRKG